MAQLEVVNHDGIAVVTIDGPDGYMNFDTVQELETVSRGLAEDPGVRVVVLTGARDDVFIRHYDVRELEEMSAHLRQRGLRFSAENPVMREREIDQLFARFAAMPQPVIAAINGTAMGGGFETCLACDLRIARRGDFALGLPEVNLGILPGAGGTQRLARLVGQARALEMAMRGRTVDPEEALALGLVHEVTDGPPLARAMEIGREFLAKSPRAVAHIKRLIRQEAAGPLQDGLVMERTLFLDLLVSDEGLERMQRMNRDDLDIREV